MVCNPYPWAGFLLSFPVGLPPPPIPLQGQMSSTVTAAPWIGEKYHWHRAQHRGVQKRENTQSTAAIWSTLFQNKMDFEVVCAILETHLWFPRNFYELLNKFI